MDIGANKNLLRLLEKEHLVKYILDTFILVLLVNDIKILTLCLKNKIVQIIIILAQIVMILRLINIALNVEHQ